MASQYNKLRHISQTAVIKKRTALLKARVKKPACVTSVFHCCPVSAQEIEQLARQGEANVYVENNKLIQAKHTFEKKTWCEKIFSSKFGSNAEIKYVPKREIGFKKGTK